MQKIPLKNILPIIIFLLFLLPIIISSREDVEQKKMNEEIQKQLLEQQVAQKEMQEKLYLTGKFDPSQRKDFIKVPAKYGISGYQMYLREETLEAFEKMSQAADADEIELKLASATRNFDYQKNLWNNKWTGVTIVDGKNLSKSLPDGFDRFKKILEYSAVPGTSRHHWGTDIDINAATPEYFETDKGEEVYEWLLANASSYGFCQPYSEKGPIRPTGYNEEKWHWSYLPLSKNFTQEYKRLVTDADIKGFDGDQYVAGQDLINNYVLAINPECL